MMREQVKNGVAGIPMLLLLLAVGVTTAYSFYLGAQMQDTSPCAGTLLIVGSALLVAFEVFLSRGFFVVAPNEGRVLQLFGAYAGTAKQPGLRWANPFYTRTSISQRVRSFESAHLKVNDKEGNPIEIG